MYIYTHIYIYIYAPGPGSSLSPLWACVSPRPCGVVVDERQAFKQWSAFLNYELLARFSSLSNHGCMSFLKCHAWVLKSVNICRCFQYKSILSLADSNSRPRLWYCLLTKRAAALCVSLKSCGRTQDPSHRGGGCDRTQDLGKQMCRTNLENECFTEYPLTR